MQCFSLHFTLVFHRDQKLRPSTRVTDNITMYDFVDSGATQHPSQRLSPLSECMYTCIHTSRQNVLASTE